MTVPTRPRRPLPRRVYWVRRLVLLAVLAAVVGTGYALVTALAAVWQDQGERPVATPAAAEVPVTADGEGREPSPAGSPRSSADTADPSSGALAGGTGPRGGASREPLPEPEGVCPDEDVVVAPSVTDAHVGEPIRVVLEVSTRTTPACTWQVSPETVFLKISRGSQGDVVWSSQQCPTLVPTVQVVAREAQAAEVVVSWSGQKSDADCSDQAGWVLPGRYRAESVARGAVRPVEQRFELQAAVPVVRTAPPTPSPVDPTPDATGAGEDD